MTVSHDNERAPRILCVCEGSILAHVGRTLTIGRSLLERGAEVYLAGSGRHAGRLESLGVPVHPLHTRPRDELLARLRTGGSAFDADVVKRYVEDEVALLKEVRPDVVVADFRPTVGISAEYTGVPHAALVNAVWTPYCAFDLDPPDSWLLTKLFGKRLLRAVRPLVEQRVFAHYAAPFNAVRRGYGLAELHDIRDCMCSKDLTLIVDSEVLFPLEPLPEHVVCVGPIIWEPKGDAPTWLDEIEPDRTAIYLTMGSTGPERQMAQAAHQLLDMDLQVMCTCGDSQALLSIDREGYFPVRFAPGAVLCRRADIVVCHAGNGTLYQALREGRPVVGVPDFHDQEFNMQRIEALGLGLRARPGRQLARRLSRGVKAVCADLAGYSKHASDFSRTLRCGRGRAVEAILSLGTAQGASRCAAPQA